MSAVVHRRLWVAMLGLALVPTVAGIVVTASVIGNPDPSVFVERARGASTSAAGLMAHEQAIGARLLAAAADPSMARLANGISGQSDRQLASGVLSNVRGVDGPILKGACIVRTVDRRQIALAASPRGSRDLSCAGETLRRQALSAPADTIARMSVSATDGSHSLVLATPLRAVTGRNAGVMSVEVDVEALFNRNRLEGSDSAYAMLVDSDTSLVIADSQPSAGPTSGMVLPRDLKVPAFMNGVLEEHPGTTGALSSMGFAATVVPLWNVGNGSGLSLVQLWPQEDGGVPLALMVAILALVIGAIIAAIATVRYFQEPFEEMVDSKVQLQHLYLEAREDALNDGLTGLGNHRAFQEQLTRQVEAYRSRGHSFALVLLDLDELKAVNDVNGHAAGDEMLRSIAQTMRELSRPSDLLYRTGGDEFAIIMPDTDTEGAFVAAERLLHFGKRPTSGARPSPFSAGISGIPYFTTDREEVYRQADAALYWAKRHGRGFAEIFEPDRDQLPDLLTDIAGHAVREVITGRLLSPVYQPIVDLRTGRILGFEGLIRPDPKGPLADTSQLFAAAAASGRSVELDLACIEAVVAGAGAIGQDRLLTLNLSPRTLEVADFDAAWLLDALHRNGISPSRVIVELTERDPIGDLQRLQKTFRHLQQYGLRIAADDVGAGNSGLRLLSQVQFDIVKIDLSLVHDGTRHLNSWAVLRSLRDLALSQKAIVVAEGVETPQQLHVIRELDIGAGQGFLLGRPDAVMETTPVDLERLATSHGPLATGHRPLPVPLLPSSQAPFQPRPAAA